MPSGPTGTVQSRGPAIIFVLSMDIAAQSRLPAAIGESVLIRGTVYVVVYPDGYILEETKEADVRKIAMESSIKYSFANFSGNTWIFQSKKIHNPVFCDASTNLLRDNRNGHFQQRHGFVTRDKSGFLTYHLFRSRELEIQAINNSLLNRKDAEGHLPYDVLVRSPLENTMNGRCMISDHLYYSPENCRLHIERYHALLRQSKPTAPPPEYTFNIEPVLLESTKHLPIIDPPIDELQSAKRSKHALPEPDDEDAPTERYKRMLKTISDAGISARDIGDLVTYVITQHM